MSELNMRKDLYHIFCKGARPHLRFITLFRNFIDIRERGRIQFMVYLKGTQNQAPRLKSSPLKFSG